VAICNSKQIRLLILILSGISSSVISGCGLRLNVPGTSTTSTSSSSSPQAPQAGGSGSSSAPSPLPQVPITNAPITNQPIPVSFQALTGCSNPNTGISNNDWGVGNDPVYTTANAVEPVVSTGTYTSNVIFWTSRETAPGQSVLMTGAFTDGTKSARVAVIPPGTVNWQALVQASSTVVPTTQQGTTGLSFIVPSNFAPGVYGFQIEDASAPPVLALANVPSVNWTIGIPSVTDPSIALQHQVHDCGAEPGELLQVFGKNFTSANQVILQSSDGIVYPLSPSTVDATSIVAAVPSALAPGTYNLWIGGSSWSATSSPASQITIYSPPSLSVSYATCPSLVGDGATDNTARLQACLDDDAPASGSKRLVYITIPSGNFVLTAGLKPHSYEFLQGNSPTTTNFIGSPKGAAPAMWFAVPQFFGMADLSFQGPANPSILGTLQTTGNPLLSGHTFFDNINFQSTADQSNGVEFMFSLTGPDIQVYNSVFLSGSNQVFDIGWGDGGIISGNQMIVNNSTGLGMGNSQNLIFKNNMISSQNTPGQGPNGYSAGTGLGISREFNQFGPSGLSQDVYVGYNTFQNMGSAGQQIISIDGGAGSYYGPVASSTASTVILGDDPAWNWVGTTNPQAAAIAIVTGTGMGQYSMLQSYSGRTINLITPWKVLPDSTSVVVITVYELNMTFAHNTITNTLGASIVLADALEGVIEDNVLTNSGSGILVSGFGPYGGPAAFSPVMNTDVLRNTIAVGEGTYIVPSPNTNNAGIVIVDFPGILLSGLLIRDNVIPPLQAIGSADGLNLVSAALIEQNQANWTPTWPIPGFLIQDNTPQ
jgi:hypothetical protein